MLNIVRDIYRGANGYEFTISVDGKKLIHQDINEALKPLTLEEAVTMCEEMCMNIEQSYSVPIVDQREGDKLTLIAQMLIDQQINNELLAQQVTDLTIEFEILKGGM